MTDAAPPGPARAGDPPPPDLRRALDRVLGDALPPVTGALAALYFGLAVAHAYVLSGPAARVMSPLAGLTALALLAVRLRLPRSLLGGGAAHVIGAAVALLVLVNCLAHIAVTGEMRQTTNLVLLLLGSGFLLVSPGWFLAVAAATAAGWAAVTVNMEDPTAPGHYAFALAQALVLSAIVRHVRVRTLTRLELERHALAMELEARQRSDERQRALLAAIPDLVFRVARDGTFLDVHAGTPGDLVADPAQFLGRNVREIGLPGQVERAALDAIGAAIAGGGLHAFEYALPMAGGDRAYEARVVRSGPAEAVLIARNVTERHAADRALRESEARYRGLFDSMPLPVWVFDVRTLRVRAVNDAAVRAYGYSREEFLALTLDRLNAAEHGPSVLSIPEGEHALSDRSGPWTHVTKDGRRIETEITTHALVFDGEPARCAVVQDVTERRRVERLKEQLVGIAAHELRSPLTAVHGSLDLLRDDPTLGSKQRELVDLAARNSERMARLIDDLLDLEKAETGALVLDRVPLTLGDVLVEALGLTAVRASRLGVGLRLTDVPPHVTVLADRARLIQVLTNLVVNALDFSPRGEDVLVSVGERAGMLRVEVADRGPGVPEGFRPRLFQRFAQAREIDRSRKGSGLGLAISRAIVEALGGRIGYEPREGGGSLFFFELHPFPAATPDRARADVA